MALLFALPAVPYMAPYLAGADDAFVVLSGSMEPVYDVGDIVFVERVSPAAVGVGDVITFRLEPGSTTLVTHRVIAVEETAAGPSFRTQGDANEDPDPAPVAAENLVGRVAFAMPLYGHFLGLVKSRLGNLIFLVLPGVVILVTESVRFLRIVSAPRAKEGS